MKNKLTVLLAMLTVAFAWYAMSGPVTITGVGSGSGGAGSDTTAVHQGGDGTNLNIIGVWTGGTLTNTTIRNADVGAANVYRLGPSQFQIINYTSSTNGLLFRNIPDEDVFMQIGVNGVDVPEYGLATVMGINGTNRVWGSWLFRNYVGGTTRIGGNVIDTTTINALGAVGVSNNLTVGAAASVATILTVSNQIAMPVFNTAITPDGQGHLRVKTDGQLYYMDTNGAESQITATNGVVGDNLGNHTATQLLQIGGNSISNAGTLWVSNIVAQTSTGAAATVNMNANLTLGITEAVTADTTVADDIKPRTGSATVRITGRSGGKGGLAVAALTGPRGGAARPSLGDGMLSVDSNSTFYAQMDLQTNKITGVKELVITDTTGGGLGVNMGGTPMTNFNKIVQKPGSVRTNELLATDITGLRALGSGGTNSSFTVFTWVTGTGLPAGVNGYTMRTAKGTAASYTNTTTARQIVNVGYTLAPTNSTVELLLETYTANTADTTYASDKMSSLGTGTTNTHSGVLTAYVNPGQRMRIRQNGGNVGEAVMRDTGTSTINF